MKAVYVSCASVLVLLLVGVALQEMQSDSISERRLDRVAQGIPALDGTEKQVGSRAIITYDFSRPTVEIRLPRRLREISALSMDGSGHLLAVEDESGHLYKIDPQTGEIIQRDRFGSGGDYEGVERVGDRILVLRSSGHLYSIDAEKPKSKTTHRTKLKLPGGCDAEALGYDDLKDLLLVGCKAQDGVRGRKGRSIYAFHPSGEPFSDEPYLFIDDDLLAAACGYCKKRTRSFHPSAIAVQPSTRELYILSAVNELLLIYSPDSSRLIRLKLDRLPQPEGITFDRNEVLYMVSEGQSKKATLYVFNPIRN